MGGAQSVEIPGGGTEGYHVLRVCKPLTGDIKLEHLFILLMNAR